MPNFLHGVAVAEINQGIKKVKTSSSSVIGVIGTAPEATEDFPLNTPVLIAGSYTEAAKLGTAGTLPAALEGILAQTGAMVVVVRIAEGVASGEGNDAITAAEATMNNVIGSVSANGTYNGVYSFLASKSILGVTPRILCAPGFSVKEVVTELNIIANRLRAIVVADCPANETNENLIRFVSDCASERIYAVYPQVLNTKNEAVPASPYVAGVIARTDNDDGFWVSPSNKAINGIIGLSKPIDFALGDASCRANYLNEQNITTIINQNGYKLWGNRSTAGAGSYQFLCVRRTADVISDSILQSHLWAVDRNVVKNYLTDVTESVNAFLAALKSQGAILAGKCVANRELNTAANITEGKVYFDFEFTPAYPAEQVTFRAYLSEDNIESILLENLAS
jgi:hypothetical protein